MYLVYVPRLDVRSNGVSLLYELALLLFEAGEQVRLVCYEPPSRSRRANGPAKKRYDQVPFVDWTDAAQRFVPNAETVAIYSETVEGNPLGASRVVRYLMNHPGLLTGHPCTLEPGDFLVSYSLSIDAELFQLFLLKPEPVAVGRPRRDGKVVLHFGKVHLPSLEGRYRQALATQKPGTRYRVVTRLYPGRKALRRWISRASLVISFDPLSNLHYESTLWGTSVLVIDPTIHELGPEFNLPLHGISFGLETPGSLCHEQVLDTYRDQLARGNQRAIARFVQESEAHFVRLGTDPAYRIQAAELVAGYRGRVAARRAVAQGYLLRNIDRPRHLPRPILRELLPLVAFWFDFQEKLWQTLRMVPGVRSSLKKIKTWFSQWRSPS